LLAVQQDDYETAGEFAQQALGLTEGLGARSAKGYALTCLGHALFGLGRLAEAAEAYQQAVALRHELKEHHLAMESLAGLAHVFLVQGDLPYARAQVEEILEALEAGSLDRTNEPIRVYLTCFQVLEEAKDPRAQDVLEIGYELLQERAAKFGDEPLRRAFLENPPAHRVFLAIWGARH
jgi:tetratricopeptide (TPR) repeat protein